MILQALYEYYERKPDLPAPGFEQKEIPFVIVIDRDGRFVDLVDTRQPNGRRLEPKRFLVPKEKGRSGSLSWKTVNLLWDHAGYVLGAAKSEDATNAELAIKQHGAFVSLVDSLRSQLSEEEGIAAIAEFLRHGNEGRVFEHPHWGACEKIKGCNLSFRLVGQQDLICQSEGIGQLATQMWSGSLEDEEERDEVGGPMEGMCLITGENGEIARIHPRTPILGSKSNAKLVSFQKNMGFDSYGRLQSFNAPVGTRAAFAYTTAMNHLLATRGKPCGQCIQIGDASTVVFWAAKQHSLEDLFADFWNEPPKDDPDRNVRAVETLFKAPHTGATAFEDDGTRFYVLGLAPNAARIAVSFWHVATVAELARHVRRHFEDLAIARGPNEAPYLPLFVLLEATAVLGKADNIAPNLAGEFMRSILAGVPYPRTLLEAAIRRVRAEQTKKHDKTGMQVPNASYPRAALIKACINRQTRYLNSAIKEELKVSLDPNNTNTAYRLGRLFATLERVQQDAFGGQGKINATIRDRYFGSASSTPVAVFPTLLRLSQHHMASLRKEKPGLYVERDKLVGQIMNDGIDGKLGFPSTFPLEDQGRFVIGYYHQRQAFFTKTATIATQGV